MKSLLLRNLPSAMFLIMGSGCAPILARTALNDGKYFEAERELDLGGYSYTEKKEFFTRYCDTQRAVADRGELAGMIQLGRCYEQGLGNYPVDYDQAAQWFTLAARWGDSSAASNLIRIGRPVPTADLAPILEARRMRAAAIQQAQVNSFNDTLNSFLLQQNMQRQKRTNCYINTSPGGSSYSMSCQ